MFLSAVPVAGSTPSDRRLLRRELAVADLSQELAAARLLPQRTDHANKNALIASEEQVSSLSHELEKTRSALARSTAEAEANAARAEDCAVQLAWVRQDVRNSRDEATLSRNCNQMNEESAAVALAHLQQCQAALNRERGERQNALDTVDKLRDELRSNRSRLEALAALETKLEMALLERDRSIAAAAKSATELDGLQERLLKSETSAATLRAEAQASAARVSVALAAQKAAEIRSATLEEKLESERCDAQCAKDLCAALERKLDASEAGRKITLDEGIRKSNELERVSRNAEEFLASNTALRECVRKLEMDGREQALPAPLLSDQFNTLY